MTQEGGAVLGEACRQLTIVNKRGLHARASAKFVGAVAAMDGAQVRVTKDGHSAAGGSILGLMMLGAAMGDTIVIHCSGDGCEEALAQLSDLVESKFGEE